VATDTLSDVLKAVRLTGAAYFDIAAQEPWSVHSPAREVILPRILPGADRLIAYHVVTSGRCYAGLVGGEAVSRKRDRNLSVFGVLYERLSVGIRPAS
jgi:Cupin